MSVTEFIQVRESIEALIVNIQGWIKKKSIGESSKKLDESTELLTKLRQMAENEIQNRAVLRLTSELEYLATKIDDILSKREAGKKEDGNVAFKCNWNDKHYKAPCSLEAYNINMLQGRVWCSSPLNECRKYNDEVSLKSHPCYESIALKEMFFAAGIDHTGDSIRPRHIHSARADRMAILTTRPPFAEEQDRLIIGCIFIKDVHDDPGQETKIYGDKEKSVAVDYDRIKIKFWDYYKNEGAENLILWASGLFRYISDEAVLNILRGIGEQYRNSGKDVGAIIDLIKYYEDLINKKQ